MRERMRSLKDRLCVERATGNFWSSYTGRTVDALGQRADEGRGYRRNAPGIWKQELIRRFPNGETRLGLCPVSVR